MTDENGAEEVNRLTVTWGLTEAAAYLRMSPDTLRRRAALRIIPGAKIGRAWVFMLHLLAEYLERECRSQTTPADVMTGRSRLAEALAERLRERRRHRK